MPLFVISWSDKPDHLPVRLANRDAHLAYVAETGVVRLGGPYFENGEMSGSMIIVEVDAIEDAFAWHEKDPYRLAGLVGTCTITPWRITVGQIA